MSFSEPSVGPIVVGKVEPGVAAFLVEHAVAIRPTAKSTAAARMYRFMFPPPSSLRLSGRFHRSVVLLFPHQSHRAPTNFQGVHRRDVRVLLGHNQFTAAVQRDDVPRVLTVVDDFSHRPLTVALIRARGSS